MKISADVLRRFVEIPTDPHELRMLLDDLGIEVKRYDADTGSYTLELLANRGDHHCYVGIATEISGRTGATVTRPDVEELESSESSPHPVVHEEQALCQRYSLTVLERDPEANMQDDGARHPWFPGLGTEAQVPLDAAGIHSISAAVDATNLSNLELGQPTHCFDAAKVVGPITIRLSRAGEKAWPLFSEDKVDVPEGTLVIADDEKILAIAGVIGCEDSKTTDDTTRILLESAHFDPVAVRKASRALGIHTDSSARFERGADMSLPIVGAGRVVHLLKAAGWNQMGTVGITGTSPSSPSISLNMDAASAFLDHPLDRTDVKGRLERLGFAVQANDDGFDVQIPPHRVWDVEFPADLYEELAKSIGYNNTPQGLPLVDMGALPSHPDQVKEQVEEILLGAGFYEVFTNGFHATGLRDKLGIGEGHPLHAHVQTTNALDRGYGLVKNNALGQAVEAIAANLRTGVRPLQMYEWTRTFHPDAGAENKVCTERHLLWAIAAGSLEPTRWAEGARAADPWLFKGLIHEIATELKLPLHVGPLPDEAPLATCLHPGRSAGVFLGEDNIGVLGEIHPSICAAFKLKRTRPIYMELDRDSLLSSAHSSRYEERSVHQPIVRALAFTLPSKMRAEAVVNALNTAGPDWLESVTIADLFRHEEDGIPVRTVTFSLVYGNRNGDRSADAVNQVTEGMIAAVEKALGERGVKLRA